MTFGSDKKLKTGISVLFRILLMWHVVTFGMQKYYKHSLNNNFFFIKCKFLVIITWCAHFCRCIIRPSRTKKWKSIHWSMRIENRKKQKNEEKQKNGLKTKVKQIKEEEKYLWEKQKDILNVCNLKKTFKNSAENH